MSRLAAAMIATVLASGCTNLTTETAQAPPSSAAQLRVTELMVAAPAGVVAFCATGAVVCAGPEPLSTDLHATASAGAPRRSDANAVFRALLEVRARAHTDEGGALKLDRVRFDETLWRLIYAVNSDVNWRISPETDERQYGVAERWMMPLSGPDAHHRGDCEDYVLEKRSQLLAAGLPANALSIVIAISPAVGRHAVLVVRTTRGDYVLDNLHEAPLAIDQLPYAWLTLQSGEDLLSWRAIASELAAPPVMSSDALKGRLPARV